MNGVKGTDLPQGWYHKGGRKQERKRKARLVKQKLEKEKAKKYRAWVRRTRAEEKEKEKKKEQQEKDKVRKKGMGASGSCGSWFIWLLVFFPAACPGRGTYLVWHLFGWPVGFFLPLGILAPKKRKSKVITGKGKGQEEGEALEEEELPEKNLTREEPN